jgi:hypothetical protein
MRIRRPAVAAGRQTRPTGYGAELCVDWADRLRKSIQRWTLCVEQVGERLARRRDGMRFERATPRSARAEPRRLQRWLGSRSRA